MKPVDEMRGDQAPEEHAVRRQKRPHEEFLVRDARGGRVIVVMIDGAGGGRAAHEKREGELVFGVRVLDRIAVGFEVKVVAFGAFHRPEVDAGKEQAAADQRDLQIVVNRPKAADQCAETGDQP